MVQLQGKMFNKFFDFISVVHHESLLQVQMANEEYYLQVQCRLCESIRNNPDLWKNKS